MWLLIKHFLRDKSCLEIASEITWGFWIKMEKWADVGPTDLSQIHLHEDQFLLKTIWWRDSCTTKAVRKTHIWSAWKEGKSIRLGCLPLRGLRRKGEYVGRHQPWGVTGLSWGWDAPILRSYPEKTNPWEDCWDQQRGCGKLGLHLWGARVRWLAQKVGHREVCPGGWWVSHDCLSLAAAEPRLWPHSLCVTAWTWIWENRNRGKDDHEAQGPPGLELKAC